VVKRSGKRGRIIEGKGNLAQGEGGKEGEDVKGQNGRSSLRSGEKGKLGGKGKI